MSVAVPRRIVGVDTNIKNIIVRKGVNIGASDLSLTNNRGGSMKDRITCRTNVGSISMKKNIKKRNNSINLKKKL